MAKAKNPISKVSVRSRYSAGVTLDKDLAERFGISPGDRVEQFAHPNMRGVICIRRVRNKEIDSGS